MELSVVGGQSRTCGTCGLLALKRLSERSSYHEVEPSERVEGSFFSRGFGKGGEPCAPCCYRAHVPFQEDPEYAEALDRFRKFNAKHTHDPLAAIAIRVISKPRDCPDWIRHQMGEGPQWHEERATMLTLEEMRDRSERERHRSEELRAADEKKRARREWTITVILSVVGIIAALSMATPDSLVGRWLQLKPLKPDSSPPATQPK